MIKKAVITHLSITKTGFLTGIIFGLLGLLAAIVDTLFNGFSHGLFDPVTTNLFPGLGLYGIFLVPVIGFVGGFLLGALTAFIFNLAGKLMGGVEIEINEKAVNQ